MSQGMHRCSNASVHCDSPLGRLKNLRNKEALHLDPIYLDYAATTPVRAEVREAMEPYMDERFGNASSPHRWGRQAQAAIEESRGAVAEALGANRREIFFVRGGTESDNLAILGRAEATRAAGGTPLIAVSAIEHKAVLEAGHSIEQYGGRCIVLPVDRTGLLDMAALDAALAEKPCCVSCMWVNNEVGVIQPIAEIAARCLAAGVALHTDAVQAVGKLPVRVDMIPVSILSLSAHKLYGPKSTGALFVREGTTLNSRIHGGGQESGLRPGTQDVPGIVGMAAAITIAVREQADFQARLIGLRDRLSGRLMELIPTMRINGEGAPRSGHVLNVGIPDLPSEMLMISLDMEGLAVSGGSACNSGTNKGSHVLGAMYGDDACASNIRFSFGRKTTEDDVDRAAEITARVVARLQSLATAG